MVAELLTAVNVALTGYVVWRVKPRVRPSRGSVPSHRPLAPHDAAPSVSPDESGARFQVIGVNPKGIRHPGSYIGNDAPRANAAWDAFRHEHDIKGSFVFVDKQHPRPNRGAFTR